MSLSKAIHYAKLNPIKPIGRNSISRFASVLTDGKDTFIGLNSYKTHTLQARFGINDECIHTHSEIAAIIKAIKWKAKQIGSHYNSITDLSNFSISVARVLKDGSPALGKPCEGCMGALVAYGITDIEWTT